jgi:hypothetical protein
VYFLQLGESFLQPGSVSRIQSAARVAENHWEMPRTGLLAGFGTAGALLLLSKRFPQNHDAMTAEFPQ